MKIFKTDSPLEQAFREIEKAMVKAEISIEHTHNGLAITYKGIQYALIDTESRDSVTTIPRYFDSEKIVFNEE